MQKHATRSPFQQHVIVFLNVILTIHQRDEYRRVGAFYSALSTIEIAVEKPH
jgi:hypothetical protein